MGNHDFILKIHGRFKPPTTRHNRQPNPVIIKDATPHHLHNLARFTTSIHPDSVHSKKTPTSLKDQEAQLKVCNDSQQ